MKPHSDPETAPANSRRRWFAGLAALGGLSLAGAAAQAQGWGRRGELDSEERARRLDYRIGRLMRDIGGTPQQKDRIVAIISAAQTELWPLREQKRQARLRQRMERRRGV